MATRLRLALTILVTLSVAGLHAATDTRVPTGDTIQAWTPLGGGTHFSEVDDPVGAPDDNTTYNSTAIDVNVETYSFAAFSLPASSTITKVEVIMRALTSGDGFTRATLRVNGSHYYVTAGSALTGSYVEYTHTWATNPDTGIAWTQADVEGTGANPLERFGIVDQFLTTGTIRCTQAYLMVTYTVAGGGPPIGTLQLLGVGK